MSMRGEFKQALALINKRKCYFEEKEDIYFPTVNNLQWADFVRQVCSENNANERFSMILFNSFAFVDLKISRRRKTEAKFNLVKIR